jgi:PAS domain S-box-containing protein
VLIVDDTPAHQCPLTQLLAAQNYTVLLAPSGAAALQLMALNLPDIVLLNAHKPRIDGYALCRHIKAHPRLCAVPVIFISANDSSWDRGQAFAAGAVDFVAHPIAAPEVLTRLETQLTLSSLRQQLEQRSQERSAELREAKEALHESRVLLKTIIDSSTAIIYVKDLNGRYLLVNHRFRQLFGGASGDMHGLSDEDIFPPEMAQALAEFDRQVIATGISIECEEVRLHNGMPHTYTSVKSALRDSNGHIHAVCTMATDITERVREEAILCELNAMLESRLSQRLPEYTPQAP